MIKHVECGSGSKRKSDRLACGLSVAVVMKAATATVWPTRFIGGSGRCEVAKKAQTTLITPCAIFGFDPGQAAHLEAAHYQSSSFM